MIGVFLVFIPLKVFTCVSAVHALLSDPGCSEVAAVLVRHSKYPPNAKSINPKIKCDSDVGIHPFLSLPKNLCSLLSYSAVQNFSPKQATSEDVGKLLPTR